MSHELFLTLTFVATFVCSLIGQVTLLRFWRFDHGVDRADGHRKLHGAAILRVGGLPIYLGFIIAFFFALHTTGDNSGSLLSLPFLLLGSALFFLGFFDDLFGGLPASLKLATQVIVGVCAYLAGMRIDIITAPLGGGTIELGGFSLIITIFWFVALPNLINLVDGMDGLAGGVGLFLSLTLGALGVISGNMVLATLSFGVAGSIVAFLAFNLPPAKIYMGDGGAYLIGFFIAGASLISSNKGSVFVALLVVFVALGFPILDTLLAIVRRALSGLPIMRPDARHLHHRLMTLGFSKRAIILFLYGGFVGLSLLGLSVFVTKGYSIPIVGMALVIAILIILRVSGIPHTLSEGRQVVRDMIAGRKDVRYAYSLAQVLEHDIERIQCADKYWGEVENSLTKLGIYPEASNSIPEGQDRCSIEFVLPGGRLWKLNCPAPSSRAQQWDRVIRCFVPSLSQGFSKWGFYPIALGILQVPVQKKLDSIENESQNSLRQSNLSKSCHRLIFSRSKG